MKTHICSECGMLFQIFLEKQCLYKNCNTCNMKEEVSDINIFHFQKNISNPTNKKNVKNENNIKNIIQYGTNKVLTQKCSSCMNNQKHTIFIDDIDIHLICHKCNKTSLVH